MNTPSTLRFDLDDLLADLRHARRHGDLGRLAAIAYFDVRRWARQVGAHAVAEQAATMITEVPHASRETFLAQVDRLVHALEQLQTRIAEPSPALVLQRGPAAPSWDTKHA